MIKNIYTCIYDTTVYYTGRQVYESPNNSHNRIDNKILVSDWVPTLARPISKLLARLHPELYSTWSNYHYLLGGSPWFCKGIQSVPSQIWTADSSLSELCLVSLHVLHPITRNWMNFPSRFDWHRCYHSNAAMMPCILHITNRSCLVPKHLYFAVVNPFQVTRSERKLCQPFVSDMSPKQIDREGLGKSLTGTRQQ